MISEREYLMCYEKIDIELKGSSQWMSEKNIEPVLINLNHVVWEMHYV